MPKPAKPRSVEEMISKHARPIRMAEVRPEIRKGVDMMIDANVATVQIHKWLQEDQGLGPRITFSTIRFYAAKRRSSHS